MLTVLSCPFIRLCYDKSLLHAIIDILYWYTYPVNFSKAVDFGLQSKIPQHLVLDFLAPEKKFVQLHMFIVSLRTHSCKNSNGQHMHDEGKKKLFISVKFPLFVSLFFLAGGGGGDLQRPYL